MHTVGRNGANQRRHTKCQRGILRPFCWACHLSTAKAHETTMFTVASNAIRIKAACMIDTGLTPWVMRTRQPPTELSHMDATQTRNTEHHFTDCCATLYMSYCVLPCLTALVSSLDTFLPISVSQRPTAFAVIRSCKKCC